MLNFKLSINIIQHPESSIDFFFNFAAATDGDRGSPPDPVPAL